jgi:hypothetical protein
MAERFQSFLAGYGLGIVVAGAAFVFTNSLEGALTVFSLGTLTVMFLGPRT